MIAFAVAIGLVLAATLQVTFAPLFPLAGATFDVPLVALIVLMRFRGPRTAMAAIPFAAIMTAFLTDRAPALVLLVYLPLLPLAYWLDESGPTVWDFFRTAMATVAVGMWLRGLYFASSILDGGDLYPVVLIAKVVIPGLFLDMALLTMAYVPLRLLGLQERTMRLQRGTYSTL